MLIIHLYRLAVAAILTLSVYDIVHEITLGFALVNITPTHYDDFESEVSKSEVDKVFAQPFYLFADGGQSFVFVSEDNQYVLKLFKFHHLRIPPWMQVFPVWGKLNDYKIKKMAFKRGILQETFLSYKNAFKFFKEESLLLDLNLSNKPNRYHSTLTIYDIQKRPFKIDPNTTPFALQKKVQLFEATIKKKLKENDLQFVADAVCNCMDLLATRINKGFIDNDCYLHKNIGLVGSKPMLLDIGTLQMIDNLDHKSKVHQIEYVMKSIFDLIADYPELKEQINSHWEYTKNTTLK